MDTGAIPHYWEQAKKELSVACPVMKQLIADYPGEGLMTRGDAFGTLARSIVGQQVSVQSADAITGRLLAGMDGLTMHNFLNAEEGFLRSAGLSRQKIKYIVGLAEAFVDNPMDEETFEGKSDEQVMEYLIQFKGIGRWTAEMFLLFYLARPDVFPVQDVGLQKAMKKHYAVDDVSRETCSLAFRPWRTVATWYLWRSLDPIPVVY